MMDEQSLMGITSDPPNLEIPALKASAVLLLCKYWDPAILNSKKTPEEVINEVSLLVVRIIIIVLNHLEFNLIARQPGEPL